MILTEDLLKQSEEVQKELHDFIDQMNQISPDRVKKLAYQDMVNCFWFLKIAELKKEIELLTQPNKS